MKICHIDADVYGSESIAHLIPNFIETYRCVNYKEVESVVQAVKSGRIKCDMVVLDTITGLTSRLRQDLVYDPTSYGSGSPIWDKRKELKATWDHFGGVRDMTNRIIMLMLIIVRDMGIPCAILAHEKHTKESESRSDPLSGFGDDKYIPNLQSGINECAYAYTDAIVRLSHSRIPFKENNVNYPRGTRILILQPNEDTSAGMRIAANPETGLYPTIPEFIAVADNNPFAYKTFVTILGRIPRLMLLYGPPKIGKTVFMSGACYL